MSIARVLISKSNFLHVFPITYHPRFLTSTPCSFPCLGGQSWGSPPASQVPESISLKNSCHLFLVSILFIILYVQAFVITLYQSLQKPLHSFFLLLISSFSTCQWGLKSSCNTTSLMLSPICVIIYCDLCLLHQIQITPSFKDPTYIGHMLLIQLHHRPFCTEMLPLVEPIYSLTIIRAVLFLNSVYFFFYLDHPHIRKKSSLWSFIGWLCLLMIYPFPDLLLPYLIYVSKVLILLGPTRCFKNRDHVLEIILFSPWTSHLQLFNKSSLLADLNQKSRFINQRY